MLFATNGSWRISVTTRGWRWSTIQRVAPPLRLTRREAVSRGWPSTVLELTEAMALCANMVLATRRSLEAHLGIAKPISELIIELRGPDLGAIDHVGGMLH